MYLASPGVHSENFLVSHLSINCIHTFMACENSIVGMMGIPSVQLAQLKQISSFGKLQSINGLVFKIIFQRMDSVFCKICDVSQYIT